MPFYLQLLLDLFQNLSESRAKSLSSCIFRNDLCGSSEKCAKIDIKSTADMDNREMVDLQRKVMEGKTLLFFSFFLVVPALALKLLVDVYVYAKVNSLSAGR